MSMPFDLTDLSDLVITNQTINGEYFVLYNCEIMKYISLKDKNGKEICEGDIIEPSMYRIGVVEWNNRTSEYLIRTKDGGWTKISNLGLDEIIGNIYENPELLGVEDMADVIANDKDIEIILDEKKKP